LPGEQLPALLNPAGLDNEAMLASDSLLELEIGCALVGMPFP
jgi:hypothetical protein